jgi:hypothetical protein
VEGSPHQYSSAYSVGGATCPPKRAARRERLPPSHFVLRRTSQPSRFLPGVLAGLPGADKRGRVRANRALRPGKQQRRTPATRGSWSRFDSCRGE